MDTINTMYEVLDILAQDRKFDSINILLKLFDSIVVLEVRVAILTAVCSYRDKLSEYANFYNTTCNLCVDSNILKGLEPIPVQSPIYQYNINMWNNDTYKDMWKNYKPNKPKSWWNKLRDWIFNV